MVDEILLYSLLCCIFHYCTVDASTVRYFPLLHGRRKSKFWKRAFLVFSLWNFFSKYYYWIAIWQKNWNFPKNGQIGRFFASKWPLWKFHLHIVLQIQNAKGLFGSWNTTLVAKIWPHSWLRHSWRQILVATRAVFCTTKRLRRLVFIYYLRKHSKWIPCAWKGNFFFYLLL